MADKPPSTDHPKDKDKKKKKGFFESAWSSCVNASLLPLPVKCIIYPSAHYVKKIPNVSSESIANLSGVDLHFLPICIGLCLVCVCVCDFTGLNMQLKGQKKS